ncbi:MAG: hypothetical protein IJV65_06770 [Kiritimatiellae bacterium]|nr:hypothetical protein [Kiritimatiellia bacterium]
MKTIHRTALVATALVALVAAPAASAGDPVLSVKEYANYAKAVNGAEKGAVADQVKTAVSDVLAAAGDNVKQAAAEAVAALSAVSTVKADSDGETAAAVVKNAVAAAAAAGSDKAESLALAKAAAAVASLVSGGADYAKAATDGLPKSVAKEVKAADADEALADVDADAVKDVYQTVLDILRGASYKMKEDSVFDRGPDAAFDGDSAGSGAKANAGGAMADVVPEMGDMTGFDSVANNPTLDKSGVYKEPSKPVVIPPKKKKADNPTTTGQS